MTTKALLQAICLVAAASDCVADTVSDDTARPPIERSELRSLTATGQAPESLCSTEALPHFDHASIVFEKVLEVEPLTPGFAILEGPLWVNGVLLMSHIGASTNDQPSDSDLVALRNGQLEVIERHYGANGLALDPTGAVVAARQADGTVTRIADDTIITDGYEGKRFNSPNDLIFSTAGDLYLTDPDWQAPKPRPQQAERAYHVSPSGKITPFGENIKKPNGVMISLNQSSLYVGGMNGLYRFELKDTGEVVNKPKRVQADLVPGGVDGLTLDCAGNLYVTASGKILILSANDEFIASFDLPGVTNVAFGGDERTTIYATTLGKKPQVWAGKSSVPGLPF